MNKPVTTKHIPRLESIRRPIQIRNLPTSLLNQKRPGRQIPACDIIPKMRRQRSPCNPRRSQSRAGNHAQTPRFGIQRQHTTHGSLKRIWIRRTSRIDNRIADIINILLHVHLHQRFCIAMLLLDKCALTFNRTEELIRVRIITHTNHRLIFVYDRYNDATQGQTTAEVGGAINRVDDPHETIVRLQCHAEGFLARRGTWIYILFPQYTMLGIGRLNHVFDYVLCLFVVFGHHVFDARFDFAFGCIIACICIRGATEV
mmetsp:Transcript_11427/g.17203  ORF Transcript_11427/g.17203 Transcript_11427/m.17203 type:complete len:258 (+) Transcript_11427:125-898(+)